METTRFLRLREVFDEAVKLSPDRWDAYLAQACQGDETLLAEARQLLNAGSDVLPVRR